MSRAIFKYVVCVKHNTLHKDMYLLTIFYKKGMYVYTINNYIITKLNRSEMTSGIKAGAGIQKEGLES